MKSKGFIKLHRKILENPIVCKDADHFSVWAYLLLNATHTEYDIVFKGKRITLQKGQLITSRKSISMKFNIAESKVQRILKLLESEHQIEQQNGNKNRLITLLNWSSYQTSEQQSEQQVNNNWTTSEQQVNTNKNVKNIKNDNNVNNSLKKDKENFSKESNKKKKNNATEKEIVELINNTDFSITVKNSINEWFEYKNYSYATMGVKKLLTRIKNENLSDDDLIFVIDNSIANNYQGIIFDLAKKNNNKGYNQKSKTEEINDYFAKAYEDAAETETTTINDIFGRYEENDKTRDNSIIEIKHKPL